jgi:hypothetical protein
MWLAFDMQNQYSQDKIPDPKRHKKHGSSKANNAM